LSVSAPAAAVLMGLQEAPVRTVTPGIQAVARAEMEEVAEVAAAVVVVVEKARTQASPTSSFNPVQASRSALAPAAIQGRRLETAVTRGSVLQLSLEHWSRPRALQEAAGRRGELVLAHQPQSAQQRSAVSLAPMARAQAPQEPGMQRAHLTLGMNLEVREESGGPAAAAALAVVQISQTVAPAALPLSEARAAPLAILATPARPS
jgi:hypothetical protein